MGLPHWEPYSKQLEDSKWNQTKNMVRILVKA